MVRLFLNVCQDVLSVILLLVLPLEHVFLLVKRVHLHDYEVLGVVKLRHHDKGVPGRVGQVVARAGDGEPGSLRVQAHEDGPVHGEELSRVRPSAVEEEEVGQLVVEQVGEGAAVRNSHLIRNDGKNQSSSKLQIGTECAKKSYNLSILSLLVLLFCLPAVPE